MRKKTFLIATAVALAASFSLGSAWAQTAPLGDATFQPSVGQSGKDVIWVPTPDALAQKMLETAKVTSADLVYDLGSGDGKIAIAAGEKFGARAVGIEFNPKMAELARRNAERAGVSDKVTFIEGDIFVEDFSKATVVTLYLLPALNLRLRPLLLDMAPGTRVVANSFNMGDWEPDEVIGSDNGQGYYWVVPAKVAGQWALKGVQGAKTSSLALTQTYQKITGTLTVDGKPQPILSPKLTGSQLSFNFLDKANKQQTAAVVVKGNQLTGKALTGTRN